MEAEGTTGGSAHGLNDWSKDIQHEPRAIACLESGLVNDETHIYVNQCWNRSDFILHLLW